MFHLTNRLTFGWCIGLVTFLMLTFPLVSVTQATENSPVSTRPPQLVKPEQADTPDMLAKQYLNDAEKGWTIREYNEIANVSGRAVFVPSAPFRIGGLAPDGYQTIPVLLLSETNELKTSAKQSFAARLETQLRWLKTQGFSSLSPDQFIDFISFSGQIPKRSVFLTADTECRSFSDQVIPLLLKYKFTATLFVAADRVGEKDNLTWNQLRHLERYGITTGCRGRNGRSLTRRKKGQTFEAYFRWVASDLQYAKKKMEAELGHPCLLLAYPKGAQHPLISAIAAKMGFAVAFTHSSGTNPFFVDRFNIHRTRLDPEFGNEAFPTHLTTVIEADLTP